MCATSFEGKKKASNWCCFPCSDPAVYGARARFFEAAKRKTSFLFVPGD
jgi:hypothetical protein